MEIPKNLLNYIEEEAKRVKFGCIRIEMNEKSRKIDVVTEYRKRFEHEEETEPRRVHYPKEEFRKG